MTTTSNPTLTGDKICPICLEGTDVSDAEQMVGHKSCSCKASYHLKCWQTWNSDCPTCRATLGEKGVQIDNINQNPLLTEEYTIDITTQEPEENRQRPRNPDPRNPAPCLTAVILGLLVLLIRLVCCSLILMLCGYLGRCAVEGRFINLIPLFKISTSAALVICVTLMFWGLLFILLASLLVFVIYTCRRYG